MLELARIAATMLCLEGSKLLPALFYAPRDRRGDARAEDPAAIARRSRPKGAYP